MNIKIAKTEKKIEQNFIRLSRSIKFTNIKMLFIYFLYFGNFISIITIPMNSSIILKIEGPGTKNIFYGSSPFECNPIFDRPNEIYVNKVKKDQFSSQYYFNEGDNEVILIWNKTITSCNCLFYGCKDIKEIDFSNFDTSNVIYMRYMFNECSSLTSLDLSNFDTSKVTDTQFMFYFCSSLKDLNISNFKAEKFQYMVGMFAECSSLISLNLANFVTSKALDMSSLFFNCNKLTFLNVSSFNTAKVKTMYTMFYNCSSLTSLDLDNFETSVVTTFQYMFSDCSKLKILNLSNFKTPKISNMDNMFSDCYKLEYINLKNAIIQSGSIAMNNIFSNTALNLVFCTIDNLLIAKVKEKEGAIIDCTEKWKENRKKIIVSNNTCVDNCSIVFNTFEYDSKCYDNCPNGSYNYITFYSEDNYRIDCSNTLEGLYFDQKDSIYKLCYSSCKTCVKEGDEYNHYCLECKNNYFYQDNNLNYSNCHKNCSNYFYYDNSTKTLHCTNYLECPIKYNKFIFDKK